VAAPTRAPAPPAASTRPEERSTNKEEAKHLIRDGTAALERGDPDAAIELFKLAQSLFDHPVHYANLAEAHAVARRYAIAIELYERYLGLTPADSPDASGARARVAELRRASAARAAGSVEATSQGAVTGRSAAARADAERDAWALRAAPAAQARPPELSAGRAPPIELTSEGGAPAAGRGYRIGGFVTAGAAAGAAVVAVWGGLRVQQLERDAADISRARYTREAQDYYRDRGERAESIHLTAVGMTAALATTSVILFVVAGRRDRAASRLAIAPWIAPSGAGVTWSGSLP
jgi:tetratricopeptide (TPR) repeat protein